MRKGGYVLTFALVVAFCIGCIATDTYADPKGKAVGIQKKEQKLQGALDKIVKDLDKDLKEMEQALLGGSTTTSNTTTSTPVDNSYYSQTIGTTGENTSNSTSNTTSQYNPTYNGTTTYEMTSISNADTYKTVDTKPVSNTSTKTSNNSDTTKATTVKKQEVTSENTEVTINNEEIENEVNTTDIEDGIVPMSVTADINSSDSLSNENSSTNALVAKDSFESFGSLKFVIGLVVLCIGLLVAVAFTIKAHKDLEDDFEIIEDAVSME
ncbi:MAG: hypothetical protein E7262_07710 [Lachnospiraceae bacterium]|nr:hypothetical protein [Lachnospiraceae bacterium]